MEFGIAPIEGQAATQLRDADIPDACRKCQVILGIFNGAKVRMSDYIEIRPCTISDKRSDGD